ncbi:MAG: NAD-dependent epimerase/dehydratase [Parcubacteria group bacterium Gr01-1014_29]|nr:MAG: NAD-dependent epimerase/dehydratase [Parcubacteria group bacterium Gr01-1014_29]
MSFLTEKKLSVVIPCYNEEQNVPELYERLSKTLQEITPRYELIFADNNSKDRTREVLRSLAAKDKCVKVILFARNFGHSQYGYSAGMEYASGDAVILMEADLQDSPEIIAAFVKKWQEGFDVIYGVRPRAAGSGMSRFFRRSFYRLFDKLSYLDIPFDAGDFSLFDRKVVDVFNAMPERLRLVRGMRAWIGFRHTGIEYERKERKGGVTSNPSFAKNFWWAKKFIFSFSQAPFDFITRVAVWLAVLLPFVVATLLILAFLETISWFAALVSSAAACVLVLQTVALSFLGESVSIMFDEVKQRPKYVIEEKINL